MRRPRSNVTWSGRAAAPISRPPVLPPSRDGACPPPSSSRNPLAALQDRYKRRRPIRSRGREDELRVQHLQPGHNRLQQRGFVIAGKLDCYRKR